MTKDKWIYWNSGDPLPSKFPEGCEKMYNNKWVTCNLHPEDWDVRAYRWPATEAEVRSHYWCMAHGCSVPDGYKVVHFQKIGFYYNNETHFYLLHATGEAVKLEYGMNLVEAHPILRLKEPEIQWVTPTDADVVKFGRLKCQVNTGDTWRDATLFTVFDGNFGPTYFAMIPELMPFGYQNCRVDARLLVDKDVQTIEIKPTSSKEMNFGDMVIRQIREERISGI